MRLFTWLRRQKPNTPATRRNRHRMLLTTLESRDVPAAWYTVHLDSAPQGTVGQTAASITSGSLHVDSAYDPSNTGTGLVFADSASDAIRTALTGGVVVNLSAVSLPPATYTFTEGTSSPSTSNHTAFAVTPTAASSAWKVYLEDLTADPAVSDWDYNDFFWTVAVGDGTVQAASVPIIGVVATSPWVSQTSGQATTVSFTLTRTGDLSQPLPVDYAATLSDAEGSLDSGTITFAANQSQASVTVTVPATVEPAERELALWVIPIWSARPVYLADDSGPARVTVYSTSASATVGVQSGGGVASDDPNATTAADFTFDRGGAAPSSALTFRYQVTVYEGADFGTVRDGGIQTAAFAVGQTSATVSVPLPAGTDPLTTSRRIAIRVLPPAVPGGYIPTPGRDAADQLVLFRAPDDPRTAPISLPPKTVTVIETGTVIANPDPKVSTRAEIRVSGGHTAGSIPPTTKITVGTGGAKREVVITLKAKPVVAGIDTKTKAYEVTVEGTSTDTGPPAAATAAEKAAFPKITAVRPKDGEVNNVKKTLFPTDWDKTKITTEILKAALAAQKGDAGTTWTPGDGTPNAGSLVATVDGVKIECDWELKAGKLVITHANPSVK